MKTKICRVCLSFLLLLTLCLTSCAGSFFEEESGNMISHIDDELLDDGRTKITVYFTDEALEPKVFYIPQGIMGVGIKDVEYEINAEDHSTKIQIVFTDNEVEPVSFNIPHGVYVDDIDYVSEEEDVPYLLVRYSDGTKSEKFYLPKGDTGNGIKFHDYAVNADNSVTIYFLFDDNTTMDVQIPAPKDGLGVESITPREAGETLFLDIIYTNGETVNVPFERPHRWYKGGYNPNEQKDDEGNTVGHDGDYFFDTSHKIIYVKEGGSWNDVISFKDETATHTITFNLNDDGKASMPVGSDMSYTVIRGSYFCDAVNGNNDIPIPTRTDGVSFKGWCTKANYDPRTMSFFTDLTPIFGDVTLYAIWE